MRTGNHQPSDLRFIVLWIPSDFNPLGGKEGNGDIMVLTPSSRRQASVHRTLASNLQDPATHNMDMRPHPYRMRSHIHGFSHGLKTCHRHVFLTAFQILSPSPPQKYPHPQRRRDLGHYGIDAVQPASSKCPPDTCIEWFKSLLLFFAKEIPPPEG